MIPCFVKPTIYQIRILQNKNISFLYKEKEEVVYFGNIVHTKHTSHFHWILFAYIIILVGLFVKDRHNSRLESVFFSSVLLPHCSHPASHVTDDTPRTVRIVYRVGIGRTFWDILQSITRRTVLLKQVEGKHDGCIIFLLWEMGSLCL